MDEAGRFKNGHGVNRGDLRPAGKNLNAPPGEICPATTNYLQLLEKAGAEIAATMKLAAETETLLNQTVPVQE